MVEDESILNNIEVYKDFVLVSVNPKLYPLSVVYAAAYALLDKVHVIIDGNPETEILVELRAKDKGQDLKELGYLFNDELVNYSIYTVQATRNKKLRESIVEYALRGNLRDTQNADIGVIKIEDPEGIRKVKMPEESKIDDPEGIFKIKTKKKC